MAFLLKCGRLVEAGNSNIAELGFMILHPDVRALVA
jgi:hypothetical protein